MTGDELLEALENLPPARVTLDEFTSMLDVAHFPTSRPEAWLEAIREHGDRIPTIGFGFELMLDFVAFSGFTEADAFDWFTIHVWSGPADSLRDHGFTPGTYLDWCARMELDADDAFSTRDILCSIDADWFTSGIPGERIIRYYFADVSLDEANAHWEKRAQTGEDILPALDLLLALRYET